MKGRWKGTPARTIHEDFKSAHMRIVGGLKHAKTEFTRTDPSTGMKETFGRPDEDSTRYVQHKANIPKTTNEESQIRQKSVKP